MIQVTRDLGSEGAGNLHRVKGGAARATESRTRGDKYVERCALLHIFNTRKHSNLRSVSSSIFRRTP